MKIFITGTDTDVGKTYCSTGLLQFYNANHYSTVAYKPIASGCSLQDGILKNSDAISLQQNASIHLSYQDVNPIAFEPAIAPHIAAKLVNQNLSVEWLQTHCRFNTSADITIIEGAGGWHTPLNHKETYADFVKQIADCVIIVIDLKLGCLNHALLTYHAIHQAKIPLLGYILNETGQAMQNKSENIKTLKSMLPIPCLANIPFGGNASAYFTQDLLR